MKIGIVGRFDSMHHLDEYLGPDSALVTYTHYSATDENLKDIVEKAQEENDALFFAGKAVMRSAEILVHETKPWSCVKRTPTSVIMTLMQALIDGNDLSRISFDLADYSEERMAEYISKVSGKPKDSIITFKHFSEYVFGYAASAIQFHINNYKSGKISCVLSGSSRVVTALQDAGIKAYWVAPVAEEVQHSINNLITECNSMSSRTEENELSAVMSIQVDYPSQLARENRSSEYYRWDYIVRTAVSFSAHDFGAAMEIENENIYNLYMRKAEVRFATENLTRVDLFYRIKTLSPNIRVYIGIGIGKNPLIAKENAIVCREAAKEVNCAYYIKENDGELQGPYWSDTKNSGTREIADKNLLEKISEESGVGLVNLEVISEAKKKYGFDTTTPGELAKMCSMSVNNMNRILVNLEASGFVQVVGMKPANVKGRPKRIIRMLF